MLWGWGTFTEWLDCRGQVCSWLMGCGDPGDTVPRKVTTPSAGQVWKGVLKLLLPPCPSLACTPQRTSPPPPLIRCLNTTLSRPASFLQKWGPHPSQPRSRPQGQAQCLAPPSLPGTGEPANGPAQGTEALLSWKAGPTLFLLT